MKATAGRGKATATRARTTAPGREQVTLSRARVQDVLDDAASRGRITRRDADELVAEIMRRGRHTGDEVADLVNKGRAQLESATRRVRKVEPVDRLVRGADRARRAAGVGPSFPITGYDELNVSQVQARIKELRRPEQRKVLNYERKHANRKSVVGALEKSLS
jgi:polyhydroxyalkanoate synthesis regulator phasin